jgi:preprotein translocase subunit YajC
VKVLSQLLPIILLVVLLFLLVIRPARKRAQHVSKLQADLSQGDEVMLTSGIFGTVTSMADDRVYVTVADGVVLTCHRGAIAEIVRDVPAAAAVDESDEPAEIEASESPTTPDASSRGAN